MLPQSNAKIFLSSQRGHSEAVSFRSYSTFSFGNCQSDHKQPFGSLYVLNDDTLAAGKSLEFLVEEDTDMVIIPVVGAVKYSDTGRATIIEAGQAQRFSISKNTCIQLGNPYENELVNFIHLWFKQPAAISCDDEFASLDLEKQNNKLVSLFSQPTSAIRHDFSPRLYLGQFAGREELVYDTEHGRGIFVFIVEGAFEVQYRLLETGDGLGIWNEKALEIEALSDKAIILLVDLPLSK